VGIATSGSDVCGVHAGSVAWTVTADVTGTLTVDVTGTVEVTTTGGVHAGGAVVTVVMVFSTMTFSCCGDFSHIPKPARDTSSTTAAMNREALRIRPPRA